MNRRPASMYPKAGATNRQSIIPGPRVEWSISESKGKTTEDKDKERWARLKKLKEVFKFGKKPKAGKKK